MARRSGRGSKKQRSARPGTDDLITLQTADDEIVHVSPPAMTATLRSSMTRLRLADELPRCLGVVSAIRGEGVTLVARSLAVLFAHDWDESVCLVELNWRSPAPGGDAVDAETGLAGLLRGEATADDVTVRFASPDVAAIPAGRVQQGQSPVFASGAALSALLEDLGTRFDRIVLDLPALDGSSESLALAARADALVMVVRQGVTTHDEVRRARDDLDGLSVLGVILNDFQTSVPRGILRRLPVP